MLERFKLSQNHQLIVLKLVYDCLFVLLVFFTIAFIADSILPGIISDHLGLYKIVLAIAINIIGIFILVKNTGTVASPKMTNKKTVFFVLFIVLLLIFNSLLSLSIWLNLFLTILSLVVGYFIYKVFTEK